MNTVRAEELVGILSEECANIADVQTLLEGLFKSMIEVMLEAEMDDHLGVQRY